MREQDLCCAGGQTNEDLFRGTEDQRAEERHELATRIVSAVVAITLSVVVMAGYFAVPAVEAQSAGHAVLL